MCAGESCRVKKRVQRGGKELLGWNIDEEYEKKDQKQPGIKGWGRNIRET